MTSVDPTDLPELRAELLEHYGTCFWDPPEAGSTPASMHNSVRDAELYYVSKDMCALAYQAAESLESFDLHPADLDAPHALMWFEEPIGNGGFQMMSLSVHGGGVTMALFMDRDDVRTWYEAGRDGLLEGHPWPKDYRPGRWYPRQLRMMGSRIEFGQPVIAVTPPWDALTARLASVLLLMKQTLTASGVVHPQRAALRRLQRQGAPVAPVRVITLRHVRRESSGESSYREYLHQWVVRGHWRRHWHPSVGEHRPIWIAPHIKGPEGAPLLGGEKVYALKR